jgi:hypothetical protein
METVHTRSNSTSLKKNKLLCVDDQVLIEKSKDKLQKVAYK